METLTYNTPDGKNLFDLQYLHAVYLDLVKHITVGNYITFNCNRFCPLRYGISYVNFDICI